MKRLLTVFAVAGLAFAAVEGVVTNQTTGQPQAGVSVTLIELGAGMKNVGTVKSDAQGKFTLPNDMAAGAPHLLQAQHQGVNYNRMLQPGTPGTGLAVEVYETSSTPRDAAVSQDMFLLEPSGTALAVSERIIFTNSGKYTYDDPTGTVKFYVPEGAGEIQVRIQGPQGMPITRPAEKGKDPNTYVIRYAMKPGETNIDVAYSLNMSGNEAKFAGKILHGGGPVRFVVPASVKLDGPFEDSGPIPGTGATAYTLKASSDFALTVTGTGSLRAAAPQGGGEGAAPAEDEGQGIDARKPLIYEKLTWVLALSFGMLAVGFVLLYRRGAAAPVRARSKS
ncbi:MAG TPA: hypothetical protein VER03_06715 [Bryobacteraceae bacterium]|nr:hypothetical protein [Bryobacteraceae bacterium]